MIYTLIGAVLSIIISLIGMIMVNKVGNYENCWGMMMYYGGLITVILAIVTMALFVVGLF